MAQHSRHSQVTRLSACGMIHDGQECWKFDGAVTFTNARVKKRRKEEMK